MYIHYINKGMVNNVFYANLFQADKVDMYWNSAIRQPNEPAEYNSDHGQRRIYVF